ncbi:putative 2OG-Fe(II) oxygenase family oxidoreductase [Tricladium varicosporioides]|nr:putative 2OG-Fe(II) oxygenase family oxidoreductase [Hymenoscyphus varicosporioides]
MLQTIDLALLEANDPNERQNLVNACKDQGFMYLNLASDPHLVDDWERVLEFMAQYFAKETEEKMKDSFKSDIYGYEPMATSTGAVQGLPDYYESLKASHDGLRWDHSKLAPSVAQHYDLFNRFSDSANKALQAILRELDLGLGRFPARSLQSYHSTEQPSLSTLSMFRYPKQDSPDVGVGHNKHTDLGTLTFLLCQSPGLQVLGNSPAGWQYVAPKKDCAIINVGDTLRFLTGNSLKSAVHRVMPVGRLQQDHRYSIAYFLRAENGTEFTDSTGRLVSAKAWHDEKFDVFRESHEEQSKRAILTGGMEQNETLLV